MQYQWMEAIKKTGVFIICAQALVHFRPNGSYEKYLKLLVGTMILIQLFAPFGVLFAGENKDLILHRAAWYEEQMREALRRNREEYETWEEQMDDRIVNGLTKQAKEYVLQDESERRNTQEAQDAEDRQDADEMQEEWAVRTIRIDPVIWGKEAME